MCRPRYAPFIHLFEHGYGASFAGRPGVELDEVSCFQSLMADHSVTAALVVGYSAAPWCVGNTGFLIRIKHDHDWLHTIAHLVHALLGLGH